MRRFLIILFLAIALGASAQGLILGGELGNSSASSPADIERHFQKLQQMGLNTVLVPMYWDMLEPQEGMFDFALTDKIIDEGANRNLHVVFLWFGAWKNSMSCYVPAWVKTDARRFPRARTADGKPLEIVSAFSPQVLDADLNAFTTWLEHVADYDRDGVVTMVQVENEIGMLEDARDHSALAQQAYDRGVPTELTRYLKKHKKQLHPDLAARWDANGNRMSGSWTEVFGPGLETDEIFMAWHYARYVEQLAKKGKEISRLPMYVNAAMNSRGRRPGQYPSAGPLAHLKDVWHAAASSIDMLSPDLYDKGFTDWVARYALADNKLFIPEIRRSADNAAQAFYVFGHHDALGFSPFSIENADDAEAARLADGYAALRQLTPLIVANRGRGTMDGFYFDADSTSTTVMRDGMRLTVSHFFTLPWDPRATDGSPWPAAGAILIKLADDEYIIAGTGVVFKFENPEDIAITQRLGEDGFAENGQNTQEANLQRTHGSNAPWHVGILSVEQVEVNPDGSLSFVRRYNGDETHQGRHVRIGVDDFQILHVKLYRYD